MHRRETGVRRMPREHPSAVVVGAGVSGCACAAILAGAGVHVTLVNSAMDRVGLPGYGPEIVAGPDGWREIAETMALLPWALRQAWLTSAAVPASGMPVLLVDRRAVSIETKRALERIQGLEFRQGLVTDLRIECGRQQDWDSQDHRNVDTESTGRAAVKTIFGEVFEADAVILSVGLGLGGRISVGADSQRAGRYGETPADGLKNALEALGASLAEVSLEVGARFPGTATGLADSLAAAGSDRMVDKVVSVHALLEEAGSRLADLEEPGLEQVRRVLAEALSHGSADGDDGLSGRWPESYPPAAHRSKELPLTRMVFSDRAGGAPVPLAAPDGRTTGEIHLSSEGKRALDGMEATAPESIGRCEDHGAPASRLEHTVRAQALKGLEPDGRLLLEAMHKPPVWATGRAAGESDYLRSLRSGALVGTAVARELLNSSGGSKGESTHSGPRSGLGDDLSGDGHGIADPFAPGGTSSCHRSAGSGPSNAGSGYGIHDQVTW